MLKLISVCFIILCTITYGRSTPLDDYVFAPDPHYGYEIIQTYNMTGYTLYILNFTSQMWYDETVSSRSLWWHYLAVTIPDNVTKTDVGFMFIDGGSNNNGMPQPTDNFIELTSAFAVATGSIGADLMQIPNAPVVFVKDPSKKQRGEDAIIAWTWKEFIDNNSDPYILLRLPMTKAAVRAMDAITDLCEEMGVAKIKKFMVAGASKRGWTTWTTAAVDNKRVFAAVPIVLDILNMNNNLHHHYKSLGGWTFAFKDYYELNITQNMDTPEFQAMQRIVDPLSYLDRYTNINLMLINSAGDEFFLPDDYSYFWNDLRAATNGSVLARRLPNAEHSCAGHEISIFLSLRSFFLSVYYNKPLPVVTWIKSNNVTHGITIVTVDIINGPVPNNVTVFYAKTLDNKRRDFRLIIADPNNPGKVIPHPVVWLSDTNIINTVRTKTTISYSVAFSIPLSGWQGFFFQLSFPGLDGTVLEVSSEVNIIPETFPFPDCFRESCKGSLV